LTLPAAYNGDPLQAKVVITDLSDVTKYTYESEGVKAGGAAVQDIIVEQAHLHSGINDDHGSLTLKINDYQNLLSELTTNRLESKIKNQYRIQVSLGKNFAGLSRRFYGKIGDVGTILPAYGSKKIELFCVGWGISTVERLSYFKRFQKKQSDGITLDSTDTAAKASELFRDILEDTDHHIYRSLGKETAIDAQGYSEIQDIDIKLQDIQEDFETFQHLMARVAGSVGAIYGIDQDRKSFLRLPQSKDSGFLFTNVTSAGARAATWDSTKIGVIKKGTGLSFKESTLKSGYSVLVAYGGLTDKLDIAQTTVNASFDMSTFWIAIPITPNQQQLQKLAILARKLGTPDQDAYIQIIGSDTSGNPVSADLRKRVRIPVEKLIALTTGSDTWLEIPFEKIDVVPLTKIFLVLEKYGDASNHYKVAYNTGATANAYWDSADGSTWTARAGGQVPAFAVRTYPSRNIVNILFNTEAYRKFGIREKPIPLRDIQSDSAIRNLLLGLSETLGRQRRTYPPITISAPDAHIPTGQYAYLEEYRGLFTRADIIGVDISLNATVNGLGADTVEVTLEDYR
jgi:hypothetical protein